MQHVVPSLSGPVLELVVLADPLDSADRGVRADRPARPVCVRAWAPAWRRGHAVPCIRPAPSPVALAVPVDRVVLEDVPALARVPASAPALAWVGVPAWVDLVA